MAVDDIVFPDGDNQNFLVEVAIDTLHAPLDVLFVARTTDFVLERGDGNTSNVPVDWLTEADYASGVLFSNLTLTGGSGATNYAF